MEKKKDSRVVPDLVRGRVLVRVQVEVRVVRQHERCARAVEVSTSTRNSQPRPRGNLRVFCCGEAAPILMCRALSLTVYVTVADTSPSMFCDELDLSRMENVMLLAVALVASQNRYDQLLVPLCSVLLPSFCSVRYSLPSMSYFPYPMRLTYRPGIELYTGCPGSLAVRRR